MRKKLLLVFVIAAMAIIGLTSCGKKPLFEYIIEGDGVVIAKVTDEQIESVVIPEKIEELPVRGIGDGAFSGCERLTDVVIPYGVTVIGDGAFSNCVGLNSITIPSSVEKIADNALEGCQDVTFRVSDSPLLYFSPALTFAILQVNGDIGGKIEKITEEITVTPTNRPTPTKGPTPTPGKEPTMTPIPYPTYNPLEYNEFGLPRNPKY